MKAVNIESFSEKALTENKQTKKMSVILLTM